MTALAAKTRPRRRDTPERAHSVAASLFAEKGYDATTTREISKALQITNGTFYHHFESKEQLLSSICLSALEELAEAVGAEVRAATGPLDALQSLVRTHLEVVSTAREAHVTMLTELRALEGERRDRVVCARDGYERQVEETIDAAVGAGLLRSDVPPRRLTLYLLSMINWTIFWLRPDGEVPAVQIADEMLTIFLNGALDSSPPRPPAELGQVPRLPED